MASDTAVHDRATRTSPHESSSRVGALLFVTALVGLGLVTAPFAFQMFSRAPKGATMIADFKPFMTNQRLDGFQHDIAEIDGAVTQIDRARPPAAASNATYQEFDRQWPAINADMTNLLDTVQRNVGNYRAVAALPDFRLFPWFFVVPGVLIAGAAGVALRRPRSRSRRRLRVVLVALGVGLVLAPLVFDMFARAPKGGHMMTAFKDLETTQKVQRVQGYFSAMAAGQGAIRLDIEAALQRSGTDLPAVAALDRDWVHILNDMTPMIGAMSDNVGNYRAVAAMPPFPMFPWFFVVPGVLVAGSALLIRVPRNNATRRQGVS